MEAWERGSAENECCGKGHVCKEEGEKGEGPYVCAGLNIARISRFLSDSASIDDEGVGNIKLGNGWHAAR